MCRCSEKEEEKYLYKDVRSEGRCFFKRCVYPVEKKQNKNKATMAKKKKKSTRIGTGKERKERKKEDDRYR